MIQRRKEGKKCKKDGNNSKKEKRIQNSMRKEGERGFKEGNKRRKQGKDNSKVRKEKRIQRGKEKLARKDTKERNDLKKGDTERKIRKDLKVLMIRASCLLPQTSLAAESEEVWSHFLNAVFSASRFSSVRNTKTLLLRIFDMNVHLTGFINCWMI